MKTSSIFPNKQTKKIDSLDHKAMGTELVVFYPSECYTGSKIDCV